MNNTVTLPTGRVIALNNVALDEVSQSFFYGPLDVTAYLTAAQKRSFPAYDVERANREASDRARIDRGLQPIPDPSTEGTLSLFVGGVVDDVTGLATGIRDFAGIGPENAGKRSPLFWAVVIGGLGFLLYQVGAFAWVKKKLTA